MAGDSTGPMRMGAWNSINIKLGALKKGAMVEAYMGGSKIQGPSYRPQIVGLLR